MRRADRKPSISIVPAEDKAEKGDRDNLAYNTYLITIVL